MSLLVASQVCVRGQGVEKWIKDRYCVYYRLALRIIRPGPSTYCASSLVPNSFFYAAPDAPETRTQAH